MTTPWLGLSLMPEDTFRLAAAPLLAAGEVDALEWSLDLGFHARLPEWLEALLTHYAAAGRLFGHGVHYSALSAAWEDRQTRWLSALSAELRERAYVHVSEHYGFMTAPPFGRGAPLPLPRVPATLAVGRDRLQRLRARLSCPLGLENLALAWNREEALAHGPFLDTLLDQAGDFLVLDLHNLYCQALNFDIPCGALLASFPLDRVQEIHISGGSWLPAWPNARQRVRCDTHDERVPAPVFELLRDALLLCGNVRVVIFERLGDTLKTKADAEQFRADFYQLREILETTRPAAAASSTRASTPCSSALQTESSAEEIDTLARFQSALLSLLSDVDLDERSLRLALARHPAFRPFRREVEAFDARALGIAARVVRKWATRVQA